MQAPFYPNLNLGALASLMAMRQQMELHEDYLDNKACPYDDDTREQLKRLLAPRIVEKEVIKEVEVVRNVEVVRQAAEGAGKRGPKIKPRSSGVDMDLVAKEMQDIRDELKQLKLDAKSLQTSDKVTIIKTRAALVEKLIVMDEKVNNQRKIGLFMSTVMTILDDLMPEENRQAFIKRLEPLAASE